MKKIMFNDRYGLTQAVLDSRKTMTRREVSSNWRLGKSKYNIGEIVAVAQSYKDAGINPECIVSYENDGTPITAIQSPGWTNKMFTRTDLMPSHIQITSLRVELLQDISCESCLREGIEPMLVGCEYYVFSFIDKEKGCWHDYKTPREAFSALIDKVSGRGTWDRNPYVVVYEFELVK